MSVRMMKGNEALAEGAVRAGCRFYGGYPITPQSEILEYMSWRMAEVDGTFIQSESEISGVNMVYGAAAAGLRAMTSSSGPGYSLKQEGISYIAASDIPCVIVNVQRYGSGLGLISPGQSDYNQVVKGGGNGDYKLLVYAPASVQENVDIMYEAFDTAEKHSIPVVILSDGAIGQMAEGVELPPMKEYDKDSRSGILKGSDLPDYTVVAGKASFREIISGTFSYKEVINKQCDKIIEEEQRWESYKTEDAEIVLVAYGITSRICKNVVNKAREEGIKAGLVRPITLWPWPQKAFDALPDSVKMLATVEISAIPQMTQDVQIAVEMKKPVEAICSGHNIPTEDEILEQVRLMGEE